MLCWKSVNISNLFSLEDEKPLFKIDPIFIKLVKWINFFCGSGATNRTIASNTSKNQKTFMIPLCLHVNCSGKRNKEIFVMPLFTWFRKCSEGKHRKSLWHPVWVFPENTITEIPWYNLAQKGSFEKFLQRSFWKAKNEKDRDTPHLSLDYPSLEHPPRLSLCVFTEINNYQPRQTDQTKNFCLWK